MINLLKKYLNNSIPGQQKIAQIIEPLQTEENSVEKTIDRKKNNKDYPCDACGKHLITVQTTETFMEDGSPLTKQERVKNGSIVEGLFICDTCKNSCLSEEDEQCVWISAKINVLEDEINASLKNRDDIIAEIERLEGIIKEEEENAQNLLGMMREYEDEYDYIYPNTSFFKENPEQEYME